MSSLVLHSGIQVPSITEQRIFEGKNYILVSHSTEELGRGGLHESKQFNQSKAKLAGHLDLRFFMLGYFTWASHQKNQILVKLEMDYRQDRGIPALNYPVTFPASSVGMSQMIDFSYSG